MAAQLTPWFPADSKPARDGIYECNRRVFRGIDGPRRYVEMLRYSTSTDEWFYVKASGLANPGDTALMLPHDCDKWRGLAAKPKD